MIFNSCRKSLFSYKLTTKEGDKFKLPSNTKVKLKVYPDNIEKRKGGHISKYQGVSIFVFGKQHKISDRIFHSIYFNGKYPNIFIAQTESDINRMIAIESTTGLHTPECRIIKDNYIVDFCNNVYILNDDCSITETGLKFVKTDGRNYIICKEEDGSLFAYSYNDLSPIEEETKVLYSKDFEPTKQDDETLFISEDEEENI